MADLNNNSTWSALVIFLPDFIFSIAWKCLRLDCPCVSKISRHGSTFNSARIVITYNSARIVKTQNTTVVLCCVVLLETRKTDHKLFIKHVETFNVFYISMHNWTTSMTIKWSLETYSNNVKWKRPINAECVKSQNICYMIKHCTTFHAATMECFLLYNFTYYL
jgi:hypothetical protein